MNWKDFFYYRESDKRGILLLLILILVLLVIHFLWRNPNPSGAEIQESDSLKAAFDDFQKTLADDEQAERNKAYEDRRKLYYEKYQRRNYEYKEYNDHKSYNKPNSPSLAYPKQEKLTSGQTIPLNESDTTEWKKIPGIGSGYANRIVKFRDLLGGFASVDQLKEVYGVDDELFTKIRLYIHFDSHIKKLDVNNLSADQLRKHPYINYKQAKVIADLRQRKGRINSIKTLQMLDEFTEDDIRKLTPYLSFD